METDESSDDFYYSEIIDGKSVTYRTIYDLIYANEPDHSYLSSIDDTGATSKEPKNQRTKIAFGKSVRYRGCLI